MEKKQKQQAKKKQTYKKYYMKKHTDKHNLKGFQKPLMTPFWMVMARFMASRRSGPPRSIDPLGRTFSSPLRPVGAAGSC